MSPVTAPPRTRSSRRAGLVGLLLVTASACGGATATTSPSTGGQGLPSSPPGAAQRLFRSGPTFAVLCARPIPRTATGIVSVPGVVGIDLHDAVAHTVCAGLHYRLDPADPSEVATVLAQTPAAGAEVPIGTTVTLNTRSG